MISHLEPSRSVGYRVFRYLLVASGIVIYVLLASFASFSVRQTSFDGFLELAWFVVRHVVLIPGLAPLVVFIAWCLKATRGAIAQGFLIVPGIVLFHFFVAVVSAHSDETYVVMQSLEFLITATFLWHLWRTTASRTPDRN